MSSGDLAKGKRARGDRPPSIAAVLIDDALPPRSRGSTLPVRHPVIPAHASPALAGIDPSQNASRRRIESFPRARGDRPGRARHFLRCVGLPPRSRGSTVGRDVGDRRQHASPALAGIDPHEMSGTRPRIGFPRARGDRPVAQLYLEGKDALPPRSRGSTRGAVDVAGELAASPALAGIDPPRRDPDEPLRGFPRARGDRPQGAGAAMARVQLPPRSRGSTRAQGSGVHAVDASPALAGIDLFKVQTDLQLSRFPRARGDRPRDAAPAPGSVWLPPRSRGSTLDDLHVVLLLKASPALAGIDPHRSTRRPTRTRFPRARGDRPADADRRKLQRLLTPRSRGSTPARSRKNLKYPASPALAGIDPAGRAAVPPASRFPRARGDRPASGNFAGGYEALPPRSRGSTRKPASQKTKNAASPALAGIDPSAPQRASPSWCFPRARGDRPLASGRRAVVEQLPPRSRGSTPMPSRQI